MTGRKKLWLALAFLVVAGAGVWFWRDHKETPPGFMTAKVQRGDLEITVLASGLFESENLVSVGAQVSGQVKSLKVELGDVVKAGQLVAEIDSLPQQNSLRTKTAALAAVKAQKVAKEASYKQAELAYKRQKLMRKSEAASQADFEAAEANLAVLKAEIAALNAQIEQASIAVDTAKIDLGYTKINAPIDGVVVAIVTKEGQTVNANQTAPTIIMVARLDEMNIRAEISEADIVKVTPGQNAWFTILGEPDKRYPATLQSIEPAPETITQTSSVANAASSSSSAVYYIGILRVPNPEGKLRISMTAEINIVLNQAKNVLLAPSAALGKKDKDGLYAARIETAPGQYEERRVKVGLNNNVQAEILDGLTEGQKVVIGEALPAGAASAASQPRRPPRMM
ncbi:MAG: efflux RND transporter periplasmic adaptor subunit [Desulfobulbaceae bacterium]|jgi:macrolide-specific efflux system membrane fusion protein|nr:efflux RND transporter periplasmic adaptor subunit [Desulfobulbaceae bacterium]